MNNISVPRITCEVSEELKMRINNTFEHGEIKRLINTFFTKFFESYDKYGDVVKFTMLAGDINVLNIVKELNTSQDKKPEKLEEKTKSKKKKV